MIMAANQKRRDAVLEIQWVSNGMIFWIVTPKEHGSKRFIRVHFSNQALRTFREEEELFLVEGLADGE